MLLLRNFLAELQNEFGKLSTIKILIVFFIIIKKRNLNDFDALVLERNILLRASPLRPQTLISQIRELTV